MIDYATLPARVIGGGELSREECLHVLRGPEIEFPGLFSAAAAVRQHFHGNRVHIQILSNAKSGLCPEDCHYCSQSSVSTSQIERYPLKAQDRLFEEAKSAKALNARRFCMGLSGRGPTDKEIDSLCGLLERIRDEIGIDTCCSIGLLKPAQAQRLKAAGLGRVNHNLNTSQRHHPNICTTHTYADRMRTLEICLEAGLDVCSGGIVGQGESDEDIVDLFFALRKIGAKSIPVNFLIPVPGTPFAEMEHKLTPMRCLRILALARLVNPRPDIRVAGGREYHLRSLQPMALFLANSIFTDGYLTEGGQAHGDAMQMIKDLGFELEIEGAAEVAA